jgi:hypothetical protein
VITYSEDYDTTYGDVGIGGLIVGWSYLPPQIVSLPPTFVGMMPIAIQCDKHGVVVNCIYMEVPKTLNSVYSDVQHVLSLCGRDNNINDIFYTWYSNTATTLRHKEVPFTNTSLPLINSQTDKQLLTKVYPNPNSGTFKLNFESEEGESIVLEIFNSIGERVYSYTGISPSKLFTKELNLSDLDVGNYIIKATGKLNTDTWKIVLSR